jgi:hypothetical protein
MSNVMLRGRYVERGMGITADLLSPLRQGSIRSRARDPVATGRW